MTPTLSRRLRAEGDRLLGWLAVGIAVALLVSGTTQLSASPYASEQVTFLINGGLAGLAVLSVGISLLLVADLRDEGHKLARLEAVFEGAPEPAPSIGGLPTTAWIVTLVLAGVGLMVGWRQASTAVRLEDALDGLVAAAPALGVAVATSGVRVFSAWSAVGSRRNLVLARLRPDVGQPTASTVTTAADEWTVAGLGRSHRRTCPSLRFADGEVRPAVTGSSLELCLICHREA